MHSNDQDDENTETNRNYNIVHNWIKEHVRHNGANVKPVFIFLSGSSGTSKSHLVKTIYYTVLKTLLFISQRTRKNKIRKTKSPSTGSKNW